MFRKKQQVHHSRFGTGSVIADQEGNTVYVRFGDHIESCEASSLSVRLAVTDAIKQCKWSPVLNVTLKAQAAAIRSLNDSWGVFSRSRIDLLPHQLWVCHRALQQWPIRLLVADDVGLGKTVEAGLILWPLLSSGKVRRLLILTPAALVEQWQFRLRTLFDIRMSMYSPGVDRPKVDFWSTHNQVIASLQTLRSDHAGRHKRLFDAPAWDMLIVDEAHHLNANEQTGRTLGYKFVKHLMDNQLVQSCLFFTGTPHRGDPYGFWSLLKLLRPEDFDPLLPENEQLPLLRQVLIRNFKQKVTDMTGNRLFQPVNNNPETYEYSDTEQNFYQLLTHFILAGNAYASGLKQSRRQQVTLVLIAMQKIASSSVAAIRAALARRLRRLNNEVDELRKNYQAILHAKVASADEVEALHRWMNDRERFRLLEDERPHLMTLLEAAKQVEEESKIARIGEIIDNQYSDRSILLFTEYKATQALMVSTLMMRFGEDNVGFINGDDRLTGVQNTSGEEVTLSANRETTATKFNQGRIRFLVSTEAGGEGIDLQENCYTLIHVDLPWNPMRLHQRVGRLNRYGQRFPVDVVTIRNPSIVESRIWDKLETKLNHIMEALSYAMDEPEDLMQMVIGMADPDFFNELFTQGQSVEPERFDEWFDAKARSFGGKSAIETVNNLVGHCQSFDLSQLEDVPKMDLPDLEPFFYGSLIKNRRRPDREGESFSFITPEAWLGPPGVRQRYNNLIFRRRLRHTEEAKQIVGVGHQVFDQALSHASEIDGGLTLFREAFYPMAVFQIQDAVTSQQTYIRQVVVAVTEGDESGLILLRDEQILNKLNQLQPKRRKRNIENLSISSELMLNWLNKAREHALREVGGLQLPFQEILVSDLALFWPKTSKR